MLAVHKGDDMIRAILLVINFLIYICVHNMYLNRITLLQRYFNQINQF